MRLDNATPQQLVRALSNDNLFWRITAQRLLIERGRTDVVASLVQLASDHRVDSMGLNPATLHALWTLHGLGALATDSAAMRAARHALHHPAASVRRAALMMLPRGTQTLDDIFAAGILPDRRSPWPVEYTVGTPILQDADAHVRLEALLVLSEIPGGARERAAVADVITFPGNARDPWIPDAAAIAGVHFGVEFVKDLASRREPDDSLALTGMRRTIHKIARHHAIDKDLPRVVDLIAVVPRSTPTFAEAMLNGIAEGWPQDTSAAPPAFTPEQKSALVAAARDASPTLAAAFTRIATRWNAPDAFKP